jgi:hypothetical protein
MSVGTFTVAEMADWHEDMFIGIKASAVDLSQDDWDKTAALWVYLLGLDNRVDSAEVIKARREVAGDVELLVRLHRHASDWVEWFRRTD